MGDDEGNPKAGNAQGRVPKPALICVTGYTRSLMLHDRAAVEVDGLALYPACGLGAEVGYEVADLLVCPVASDGGVGGHV